MITRGLSGTRKFYRYSHFGLGHVVTLTNMVMKSHSICLLMVTLAKMRSSYIVASIWMRSPAKIAANNACFLIRWPLSLWYEESISHQAQVPVRSTYLTNELWAMTFLLKGILVRLAWKWEEMVPMSSTVRPQIAKQRNRGWNCMVSVTSSRVLHSCQSTYNHIRSLLYSY